MSVFKGRTRVRYYYSRWGYTRGNGKTWHGGIDLEGLDDTTIYMPSYDGKSISGTVTRARIVTDKTNPTWEWGYYVCVQLDAAQTPDPVNYLYFCHCSKLLVQVGQKVKTGDALAIMGNTGNAAQANPPFAHCHFEVRRTATSKGLDPTHYAGCPNQVGTYTTGVVTTPEVKIPGIDVSKYQGDVDWKAVANAGYKFAFLRAVSSNNNGLYVDPYFEKNYTGAKAAGLDVGAYFFSYANNEAEQNAEIEFLLKALEGKTFEYPIAYDIEDTKTFTNAGSKAALTAIVKRGLDILDQKGYYPILYTYSNYMSQYLDMSVLEPYDLWLANYTSSFNGEGQCDIWQYTSQGSVPGVNGNCDLNYCYKKYAPDKSEPVDPDNGPEDAGEDHNGGETTTPESGTHVIVSVSDDKYNTFKELASTLAVGFRHSDIAMIGPMSAGDVTACSNLAVEKGVLFVCGTSEGNLKMATVGPMDEETHDAFEEFAKGRQVGFYNNAQCAIGPMSTGDINRVINTAKETGVSYIVKVY